MKKLLSLFLAFSVFMGVFFIEPVLAESKTTVIACSDFQNAQGNAAGKTVLSGLVETLKNEGITTADGFLCCGDYDYEYTETLAGINTVKETVKSIVDTNMVFAQGNHDAAIGTNGLSFSGDNDPENKEYGVFVINEDDYMWNNSNEQRIKETAQSLIEYLNKKIKARYDKPIFVVSHLPLHYSMRTKKDGDGQYASYIFNALNEAGGKGLNIIFLFGHDHSNGWDDYLGGAAIYLKKGDNILIANNSKTSFYEKTLNFTYMNAGYIGYYGYVNEGADDTLTMTVFEFTDKELEIARYNAEGVHNLKSEGVRNSAWSESEYEPDKTVYTSPKTVTLTEVTDTNPIEDLIEVPKPPAPEISTEDQYARITSVDFLEDGCQYLLVYNSGTDLIMLPEVKRMDRIGFNLEQTTAFGGDIVKGDYKSKLWTFNKTANGWTLKNGEKYAAVTNTATHKITATLEDTPSEFVIGGTADKFTFATGKYVLNYNSRGLINGYEQYPAEFYIYKYFPENVELTIQKEEDSTNCKMTINDVPENSMVIIACYLDNRLVCTPMVMKNAKNGMSESFSFTQAADKLKIFVFEKSNLINPVCEEEELYLK